MPVGLLVIFDIRLIKSVVSSSHQIAHSIDELSSGPTEEIKCLLCDEVTAI